MERYPLIAYLDDCLTDKVRNIQMDLSRKTGSRGCLEAWEPHISVGSEVRLSETEVPSYVDDLRGAAVGINPITMRIQGFGFIDDWAGAKLPGNTPYGVYLKVVVSPELLRLAEVLRSVSASRNVYFEMPWPYRPHVAVAYKDLTHQGYMIAKEMLEKAVFDEIAVLDTFSLAKHNEIRDDNKRNIDISLAG